MSKYQTNHHIVILGAGYAGMMAAYRLSGTTNAQITLINASDTFVERIRLHQRAAGQQLKHRPLVDMLRGKRVNFMQGTVIALRPEQREVHVQKATGNEIVAYDTLLYALGSTTERDRIPGVRDYAYGVTSDEMTALHEKLATAPAGTRLVVCGGGLTGIESATELAEAYPHVRVTMVTRESLGAQFSRKGQVHVQRVFKQMNITVLDNLTIQRLERNTVITEGQAVPFDVCLWTGAFTALPLAREAGITTNLLGQIVVNEYLQSVSHPEIYAAGDAATVTHLPFSIRMACATALPMAAQAASNVWAMLNDKAPKPFEFSYYVQCVSLGRKNAIVQVVNADDTPEDRIFTGRIGAMIKEGISWATVHLFLGTERLLPGSYSLPTRGQQVARVSHHEHGRI